MENIVTSLISCNKIITKKPHREMYPDKQSPIILRNDFECKSEDGEYEFSVFMRKSTAIENLFSIGLRVEAKSFPNGSKEHIGLTILRCNGAHEHTNSVTNKNKFDGFHIHTLEDHQFIKGLDDRIDAELTNDYNNFNKALHYFLVSCGISNYGKFFSRIDMLQQTLMESDNRDN